MKIYLILQILLCFTHAKGGKGGGGGSGGGGGGGTSGGSSSASSGAASGGLASDGGNGIDYEAGPAGPAIPAIKWIIIISVIGVCISFVAMYFCEKFKRLWKGNKDIEAYLGVALARINNTDIEVATKRVQMGVGSDINNINDWVIDIWESFDRDGNGQIDKFEVKSFIDQTFKTAGIFLDYD